MENPIKMDDLGVALQATLKVEHSWQGGQFHCLVIEDHLWINYYVAPYERFMSEQASRLQEQLEKSAWKGPWIMAGDFNETYEGSWVATVAALNGGHMEEFSEDVHATRWDGKRIIDLVMTNFQTGGVTTRKEKISDHKILEFEIKLKHLQEIEQRRYPYFWKHRFAVFGGDGKKYTSKLYFGIVS